MCRWNNELIRLSNSCYAMITFFCQRWFRHIYCMIVHIKTLLNDTYEVIEWMNDWMNDLNEYKFDVYCFIKNSSVLLTYGKTVKGRNTELYSRLKFFLLLEFQVIGNNKSWNGILFLVYSFGLTIMGILINVRGLDM